jgi:predicted phosphoribosyltransferase
LKAEIERTKESLAANLAELKTEAAATQKRVMVVAGCAAGVYVAWKVARYLWRRSHR